MDMLVTPDSSRVRAKWMLGLRHAAHLGPILVLSIVAAALALSRARVDAPFALRALYAAVAGLNVLALAMSAWCAVLGAGVALAGRFGWRARSLVLGAPTGRARTAIVMPIYEEDAARVFAAAAAMAEAIASQAIGRLDIFVLSDTQTPDAVATEQTMHGLVSRRDNFGPEIFYRHRADNRGRKAGNIADFVTRWGADYPFMVVLDADSLMSGEAVARLIGAMEANPRAGLIQAMCYPVGRQSFFARHQQFAACLYGPLFQRGVTFWQGPHGNFWGHNAIVRTSAFAASCGLPSLRGRPPFGGEILSHDTVEAALMLRGGFEVWMLPNDPDDGSWEGTPTNLLDHLERDRRWCRGNLQHFQVVVARGLRIASLYHLVRGILHYLYAPIVLTWIVLFAAIDRKAGLDAFVWLTAIILVLPRILCVGMALADRRVARPYGGRTVLLLSAIVDQLVTALAYPVTLAVHIGVLAETLSGSPTIWRPQKRDDRDVSWRDAATYLALPAGVLLAVLVVLAGVTPWPALLLGPGLVAAFPLAVLGSRRGFIPHLFQKTPEETRSASFREDIELRESILRSCGRSPVAAVPALPAEAGLVMAAQSLRPFLAR